MEDTAVASLIEIGQKTFAEEVGGLPASAYLAIRESFDMDTTMGFNLTISGSTNNDITTTNVAVTDVDALDQTGTAAATELQAQIRAAIGSGADLTVAWTDYAFTIRGIRIFGRNREILRGNAERDDLDYLRFPGRLHVLRRPSFRLWNDKTRLLGQMRTRAGS